MVGAPEPYSRSTTVPHGRDLTGPHRGVKQAAPAALRRPLLACAQVAQLVEQETENLRVGGSIPPLGTTLFPI